MCSSDLRFFHVAGNAGVAGEVAFDVALRGTAFKAELTGKAKGAHAVDEAEVDDLGDTPLISADFGRHKAEDFGRCGAVYVLAVGKCIEQAGVLRKMRHDAQFDLRVVG